MAKFLEKIANFSGKCLIYEDTSYTYKDLCEKIEQKGRLLENLPQGSTIAILGDYDMDSISMLFACYQHKMIVAPLTQSSQSREALQKAQIEEAQIEYVYTHNSLNATGLKRTNDLFTRLQNTSGLILFSSGSTGKPKVIVHDLSNLLDSYLQKRAKPLYLLLFLGFDHIGGLNTLFQVISIGGCGIAIKNRKDIQSIAKALQDYRISLLPASPSLLNLMLISGVKSHYDLSSLRIITYGSEAMPSVLLEKLKKAFPKVRFHQTFGTSETGITQTKSLGEAIKLENIDYKILKGELFLKSKTQSLGYLNADNSVFDEQGYFATGDLVEVIESNGEEYIKIIGRSKEIINVGGEKVLPSEVEGILLEIPYIQDCLVYGESNAITGQSVSVKVVLDSSLECKNLTNIELKSRIRAYCKEKLSAFKIPTKVSIVKSLQINARFKKTRR